jgi:hypothetical protein
MYSQYEAINREAIWAALFAYLKSKLTAAPWAPDTAYTLGQLVTDDRGHLQKVTAAGTSGATAPAWGGSTTDDLTPLAWQDMGPGFVTIGRKHVPPPDLTVPDQPALFQVAGREVHIPTKPPGAPTKLVLRGFLVVYCYVDAPQENFGSETLLGETLLNSLLYAIDLALLPDDFNSGKFTIGGQVTHCWIDGDTDLDPGIFGSQAAALLPLNILVP